MLYNNTQIKDKEVIMNITLDKMSVEEKLKLMEEVWNDLIKKEQDIPSPEWHKNILGEREDVLKSGKEVLVDWKEAKERIRNSIS
jgi:hypothetical protein